MRACKASQACLALCAHQRGRIMRADINSCAPRNKKSACCCLMYSPAGQNLALVRQQDGARVLEFGDAGLARLHPLEHGLERLRDGRALPLLAPDGHLLHSSSLTESGGHECAESCAQLLACGDSTTGNVPVSGYSRVEDPNRNLFRIHDCQLNQRRQMVPNVRTVYKA